MSIKTLGLRGLTGCGILAALAFTGCSDKPTLFPNPDPSLRMTTTQFRHDASARFPYKTNAPHEQDLSARGQIRYSLNRLEILNISGQEWSNVEVWVNRQYVCHIPKMEDRKLKEVQFSMLMDETGKSFPFDNRITRVETVEIFRDGKMSQIICRPAEF